MARVSQSSLPIAIKISVIRRLQNENWSLPVTALLAWVTIIQIELEPNLGTQTESERFSSAHFKPGSTTPIDLDLLYQTRFMCLVQKPQHNVHFCNLPHTRMYRGNSSCTRFVQGIQNNTSHNYKRIQSVPFNYKAQCMFLTFFPQIIIWQCCKFFLWKW